MYVPHTYNVMAFQKRNTDRCRFRGRVHLSIVCPHVLFFIHFETNSAVIFWVHSCMKNIPTINTFNFINSSSCFNCYSLLIPKSRSLRLWSMGETGSINWSSVKFPQQHNLDTAAQLRYSSTGALQLQGLAICIIGVWTDTYVFYQSVLQKKTWIWSLCVAKT